MITKKEKLVIAARLDCKSIIVKIPFNQSAVESEDNNKILLENIRDLRISPEFIVKVSADGLTGYVEEMIEGNALRDLINELSEKEIYTQISQIIKLKNPSNQLRVANFKGTLYQNIVEKPLTELHAELNDPELDSYLRKFFKKHLHNKSVAVGLAHGDMSTSNIFIEKNQSARLIDWEVGMLQGLPILDVINYLASEYRYKNSNERMLGTLAKLTSKDFMDTNSGLFLQEQYQNFEMNIEIHEALVYLNWLHNVVCLLPYTLKYNKIELDRFIYDVVKQMQNI
jgi:hypothetical protein